jgi:hypothetical protein
MTSEHEEVPHPKEPWHTVQVPALQDNKDGGSPLLTLQDCPRYSKCNAPRCPLDPEWRIRVHIPGDAVCPYLLEAVKDGAAARFKGSPVEAIVEAATKMLRHLDALGTSIRYAVQRATKSASRVDMGRWLNRRD